MKRKQKQKELTSFIFHLSRMEKKDILLIESSNMRFLIKVTLVQGNLLLMKSYLKTTSGSSPKHHQLERDPCMLYPRRGTWVKQMICPHNSVHDDSKFFFCGACMPCQGTIKNGKNVRRTLDQYFATQTRFLNF